MKKVILILGIVFISTIFIFSPVKSIAEVINATNYLGQTSWSAHMTNSPSGSINALGFGGITSDALDTTNHRLFVSDTNRTPNNRILVYQLDSNNNISSAMPINVLGVNNFTSAGIGAVTS